MKKITALFFLGLFILFLLPPYDPDFGWHLRCGEEFWQGKGFCQTNNFSVLLENYSWPSYYWAYQAAVFLIYHFSGFWGLSVANAVLMTAAFGFFWKAIDASRLRLSSAECPSLSVNKWFLEKMLGIILVVFFGWGVFSLGLRSQLVGFLLFNILLWLFAKAEKNPKAVFFFPLVMLFWANLHGGSVILGLILLAYFFFLKLVGRSPRKEIISLFLISNFSFLISFLNPSGAGIYTEAWRHLGGLDLSKLIAEWVAPEPAVLWPLAIAGMVVAGLIFCYETGQKKLNLLLLLPFYYLLFKARRNVPFYVEVVAFLFLTSSAVKEKFSSYLSLFFLRRFLAAAIAGLILVYAVSFHLPVVIAANSSFVNYCEGTSLSYPYKAVEFLKNIKASGNIFNRYEWGGFLIWQRPEQKIFVDGRMVAWNVTDKDTLLDKGGLTVSGKSPYTIYLETLQNQPGWEETLENYKIEWLFISPGTFMDLLLQPDPRLAGPAPEKYGYREAYRDGGAVIYQKSAKP